MKRKRHEWYQISGDVICRHCGIQVDSIEDTKEADKLPCTWTGIKPLPEERIIISKLIDALIGMVGQHCSSGDLVMDDSLSANEDAIAVLVEVGYLERVRKDRDWYRWVDVSGMLTPTRSGKRD